MVRITKEMKFKKAVDEQEIELERASLFIWNIYYCAKRWRIPLKRNAMWRLGNRRFNHWQKRTLGDNYWIVNCNKDMFQKAKSKLQLWKTLRDKIVGKHVGHHIEFDLCLGDRVALCVELSKFLSRA